jgi:hypothetical protein
VQLVVRVHLSCLCSRVESGPFSEGLTSHGDLTVCMTSRNGSKVLLIFPFVVLDTRNRFRGRKCELADDIKFRDDDPFTKHVRKTPRQSPVVIEDEEQVPSTTEHGIHPFIPHLANMHTLQLTVILHFQVTTYAPTGFKQPPSHVWKNCLC